MSSQSAAIILAAGQGKRMQSDLPKVLHAVGGLPLICHVVRRALACGCAPVVVVVSPTTEAPVRQAIKAYFDDAPVVYAVQPSAQGTGDATQCGLLKISDDIDHILIMYGDVPLLQDSTLSKLRHADPDAQLTLLTAHVPDPTGYGRIVRDGAGHVAQIVEHKDANEAQRAIDEINAGVYWIQTAVLKQGLGQLGRNNVQNELYLTDVVAFAATQGHATAVAVEDHREVQGVNSRQELGFVGQILRQRQVAHFQAQGVTFEDPGQVVIEADVQLARDVYIGVGVQLRGKTSIQSHAKIEGPTVIIDTQIDSGAMVHAFSHLEQAHVGPAAKVGPYARLRPQARLEENTHVGNFVEVKKSTVQKNAKVNHLSYIGDAIIGVGTNVGAGTITCNYDGFNKNTTHIGAHCFIGSHSTLVAPLTIGDNAFVAAGSTITKPVPSEALAFGRAKQSNREGYATVIRKKFSAQKK